MKTADDYSEVARLASLSAGHWLEHAAVAHAAHEQAASAHDNEALGPERDYHLRRAAEHRKCAQYWAKREAKGF